MTKYIIGEIFSSGGATLYKNPSDQTAKNGKIVLLYLSNLEFHILDIVYLVVRKPVAKFDNNPVKKFKKQIREIT